MKIPTDLPVTSNNLNNNNNSTKHFPTQISTKQFYQVQTLNKLTKLSPKKTFKNNSKN